VPNRYLGQTIHKYRVTRLLGSGAFSWVYEAIDQDLEIPVALKILRPEFAGHEQAEAQFRKEAATVARLRHRNIVTVRDVGHAHGTVYVVMDLHPSTLGQRLALAGRLPERECVRIGLDVASALAIAHAGGIIHRDIKPDNILLDTEGEAVVADFGLARALAGSVSLSATNQIRGTPQYFSPEQARGHEIDGRSDLYALGVTLYRTATGRLPFEGDDWYRVATQHIEQAPTPPRALAPDLTPEFDAIIVRLLAKQPEQRYQTASALLDALGGLATSPTRESTAPLYVAHHTIDAVPAIRAPRRRLLGGVVALLGITAAAWFGLQLADGTRNARVQLDTVGPDGAVASLPVVSMSDSSGTARAIPFVDSLATTAAARRETSTSRPQRSRTVPTNARIEILASDSARLYVDNRLVGRGRWSGDVVGGTRFTVRAVIASAPTTCDVAMRDTTVVLKAGERATITLPVRTCVPVTYDITPRDARVRFTPVDGGPSVELRADSARAVSLPEGRYEVRIQAPRCVVGTDTLSAVPKPDGSPITRRFPLICS
jgi:serine/threonine protein kinase